MKLKYKIWLDNEGKVFGEGPYRLLKGVQATGSLAQAAKEQNMSYSRAHGLIKQISVKLGFPLIEAQAGGSGGGGARVTRQAENLMRRYEALIRESAEHMESVFARYFGPETIASSVSVSARPKHQKPQLGFSLPQKWKSPHFAKGDVVALTGGGGKSSLMYALAGDFSQGGAKILLTTTTKIFLPDHGAVHRLIVSDEHGIVEQMRQGVRPQEIIALGCGVREGKLLGLSPDFVDKLVDINIADYILVEADGAAGRPFKAPDVHEPVIPSSSTVVLNMAGLDALEAPLTEEYCYHPALVASICGLPLGAKLDGQAIADVMYSSEGGRKNLPRGAHWLPVINKIDNAEDLQRAIPIARALVQNGADEVLFASVLKGRMQVRIWNGAE